MHAVNSGSLTSILRYSSERAVQQLTVDWWQQKPRHYYCREKKQQECCRWYYNSSNAITMIFTQSRHIQIESRSSAIFMLPWSRYPEYDDGIILN